MNIKYPFLFWNENIFSILYGKKVDYSELFLILVWKYTIHSTLEIGPFKFMLRDFNSRRSWTSQHDFKNQFLEIENSYFQNGFLSALPYVCMWIVANLGSQLADYVRTRSILSTRNTRKVFNSFGKILLMMRFYL